MAEKSKLPDDPRMYIPATLQEAKFPKRFWGATLGDLDSATDAGRTVDDRLRKWAARRPTRGLLLLGKVGTGKTYRAAALAGELALFGLRPQYMTALGYIEKCRDANAPGTESSPPDVRSHLLDCGLIVIDDLGVDSGTDFAGEQLDALIDEAYGHEKLLIVTSNLSPNQIADRVTRTFDRLTEICETIVLPGTSRRIDAPPSPVPHLFYEPEDRLRQHPITVARQKEVLRRNGI